MSIYSGTHELDNLYNGGTEIENVYKGGTEIWNNSIGTFIKLGSGTSFNVKNLLPDDYSTLSTSNFYLYGISGRLSGAGTTDIHTVSDASGTASLVKSYNSSTGVLSCYESLEGSYRSASGNRELSGTGSVAVAVFVPNKKYTSYKKVTKLISLGTGQTFNVASIFPNYATLTTDDFYISTLNNLGDGEHGGTSTTSGFNLSLSLDMSYNSSTGQLVLRGRNLTRSHGYAYSNVTAYLIRNKDY